MLIKLNSNTSGEMIILAEHARRLFELMGKEWTARGVFTNAQLPEALSRLHQAVDEEKLAAKLKANEERDTANDADDDDEVIEDDDRQFVSLGHRAVPLIHLMEWTLKEGGFILWETDCDF